MKFLAGFFAALVLCGSVAMTRTLPDANYTTSGGDVIEVKGGRAALITINGPKGYYSIFPETGGLLHDKFPFPVLKVNRDSDWSIQTWNRKTNLENLDGIDEARCKLKFHPFRKCHRGTC